VSCYTCGTRCPNNIQTARITETLKKMSKEAHLPPLTPRIADFHNAFMTSTGHLGRVNEIELMAIYETKTLFKELAKGNLKAMIEEMKSQAKLGAEMTKLKRMHFGMDRVKNRAEIKALYKKSKGR
jgi:heterodisulfide reductase subunit C